MSDEKFDLDKYLEEKTQPIEKPSEVISGGGAGRGFVNPPTVEDLNKSEAELERKKIAAGVGSRFMVFFETLSAFFTSLAAISITNAI